MRKTVFCFFSVFIYTWFSQIQVLAFESVYSSENLIIQKISDRVFVHISYLQTRNYGRVQCNGMIINSKNEAVVVDTPTNDEASMELITWVETALKSKVVAVVPTHFHQDNLGGLGKFHQYGIRSFAYHKTLVLASEKGEVVPLYSFDKQKIIPVGDCSIMADFFGEGHTCDNIVCYFPAEKVLFGGCLIKEMGAGLGNLEEANPAQWCGTIRKLKEKYPEIALVIPGHGKPGGTILLDYTMELFASYEK